MFNPNVRELEVNLVIVKKTAENFTEELRQQFSAICFWENASAITKKSPQFVWLLTYSQTITLPFFNLTILLHVSQQPNENKNM